MQLQNSDVIDTTWPKQNPNTILTPVYDPVVKPQQTALIQSIGEDQGSDQVLIDSGESSLASLTTQIQAGAGLVAPSELAQLKEEDNMSISDIIRQRFKKEEHITEVKTPQDVAQIIIKNPDDANLV